VSDDDDDALWACNSDLNQKYTRFTRPEQYTSAVYVFDQPVCLSSLMHQSPHVLRNPLNDKYADYFEMPGQTYQCKVVRMCVHVHVMTSSLASLVVESKQRPVAGRWSCDVAPRCV